MSDELSAYRLSLLLRVVDDVAYAFECPDETHIANDAWLNNMLGSVRETAYACIHNEDMDFKKLDRIRVECNSLLHAIHAKPPQSDPISYGRLKDLLPHLQRALAEADEKIERLALASFGVEETKAEEIIPGDWREHDVAYVRKLLGLKRNDRNKLPRWADTEKHPYLKRTSRKGHYRLDHSHPFIIGKKAELSTM